MKDQFQFDEEQAEKAAQVIERLENNLIHTLDAHRLGILVFDSNGDVLSCNRQWERIYQMKYADVAGYNVLNDINVRRKPIWDAIKRAYDGVAAAYDEDYFAPEEWGKHGRPCWTQGNVLPLYDSASDDRLLGTAVFLHDITDKKVTASELEQLRMFLVDMKNQQEHIARRLSDLLDVAQRAGRHGFVGNKMIAIDRHPFIPRREREVFEKLAAGYTVKEAAHQLGLGIKSVYTYRSRLLKRLGLTGDVGLALAWREIYSDPAEPDSSTETNTEEPS